MARLGESSLLAIIWRIYEAAEDPLAWSKVLRALGTELTATMNVFVLNDATSPGGEIVISEGGEPKLDSEYNDYFHSLNIILHRLQTSILPGRVIASTDVCTDNELMRTEYYQDWLRRRDVFYFIGGSISSNASSHSLMSFARPRRAGRWTSAERDFISALMPHLQRAARCSSRFARMRQERDEILNRLPMGIIVINESGKVEFLNRAAEVIVRAKSGLCCDTAGVYAIDPIQASRLRALISDATLTASGKGRDGGGSMSVIRPSGRPLSILVAPMMPAASPLSQSPRVAIFITDPEAHQPANIERLAALFNLTAAESKMAGQLLQGKNISEAADALSITQDTARVHLKRIFGKTYTSRQSELLRLLLNSPAALRDRPSTDGRKDGLI